MCNNFDSLGRRKRHPFLSAVAQNDGLGGKPQFSALINTPEAMRRLGHDLIAMAADDMRGCLPVRVDNEICAQRITAENLYLFEALMDGYSDACKLAGLVNVTGELAIMCNQIGGFSDRKSDDQLVLTWTASCTGLLYRGYNLALRKVTANMPIVGLIEDGYRCNGGGWLTNLLLAYYGSLKAVLDNQEAMDFVASLTIPSEIYCKALARAMGWTPKATIGEPKADIRAVAHITGGGLGKLSEALPEDLGAYLDNMPDPPKVLLRAQEMSWSGSSVPDDLKLTDEKGYTTLHGGCGMMVVTANDEEARKLIKAVGRYGIKAQVVGQTKFMAGGNKKVTVVSRYLLNNGQLIYPVRQAA